MVDDDLRETLLEMVKDKNLTAIDLTITETDGAKRVWDAGQDTTSDIHAGKQGKGARTVVHHGWNVVQLRHVVRVHHVVVSR